MSLEDHDLIDRALDTAEEKIYEQSVEEGESSPSEPRQNNYQSESDSGRDESGRFTKRSQEVSVDNNQESENVEPESESTGSYTPVPAYWPAELRHLASGAPKELINAFMQFDAQREEWARRSKSEGDKGKYIQQRLYEDMENNPDLIRAHKAKLRAQGIGDEIQELHRYRSWDVVFEQDPVRGILKLLQNNGLTPEDLYNEEFEEEEYPDDPRINEALEEARQARQAVDQYRSYVHQQQEEQFYDYVDQWKEGTDSQGQPRRAFAEMYAPQITK